MIDSLSKTKELGTKPIGKLLWQYALPAIIAMTASSLYNMVDSIFIGQGVGAMAISGLAITFPFMNLSAAFGAMVGVGSATILSVRLGQRDYENANKILGNCVVLNILLGLFFMAISLLFLDPILRFFGATNNTLQYAREYMVVILIGNAITHLYLGLNAVLRSIGKPNVAMMCTIFTVIVNAILDPIFIFVLKMGIQGAAIATIISQLLCLIWQIVVFANQREIVHFKKGIFTLKQRIVSDILSIGMAPFLMNLCACIVVIFFNQGLLKYGGDLSVGAYGIVNRIGFVFVMIVMGINQGMQPISGYNYGAQQMGRVKTVYYKAMYYATAVCCLAFVIAVFFPSYCVQAFTHDKEMIALASEAMIIYHITFPVIGFQMVTTTFFQSIGKAKIAIFLSLLRQLIFLLPGIIILPLWLGINGVWYTLPLSDILAAIVTAIVFLKYRKKLLLKTI